MAHFSWINSGSRQSRWPAFGAGAIVGIVLAGAAAVALQPSPRDTLRGVVLSVDRGMLGGILHAARTGRTLDSGRFDAVDSLGSYAWLNSDNNRFIAHRLGARTAARENTLGALDQSYAQGFRVFEVDLVLTKDEAIVCYHPAAGEDPSTLNARDIAGPWTGADAPCTLESLIGQLAVYPDIQLILDPKNREMEIYRRLAAATQLHQRRRLIPQVYDFGQIAEIAEIPGFAGPILTAYRLNVAPERLVDRLASSPVRVLTVPDAIVDAALEHREAKRVGTGNLAIMTHSLNDLRRVEALFARGLAGVYTSHISPEVWATATLAEP